MWSWEIIAVSLTALTDVDCDMHQDFYESVWLELGAIADTMNFAS